MGDVVPSLFKLLAGSLYTLTTAPAAHQTIGANSAGTAWALRTPGWLDTAQTWAAAQTFSSTVTVAGIGTFSAVSGQVQFATNSSTNVFVLKNSSVAGYDAIAFHDNTDLERLAIGYGNASVNFPIFQGYDYIEVWDGPSNTNYPSGFRFCPDGNYGTSGSGFRNYQSWSSEINSDLTYWKRIPFGTSQVPIARFHRSGFFLNATTTEPASIDIMANECADWIDFTGGSVVRWFKARDAAGALYKGSVALSTSVAAVTVRDTFTAADSTTVISAGRTPDTGSAWGASGSNWGISSNKAYRSSGSNDAVAFVDSGLTSFTVEADITLSSVRASVGLAYRYSNAANYCYAQIFSNSAVKIFKVISGSFTQLASTAVYRPTLSLTLGSTYKMRINVNNDEISVYLDNLNVLTIKDATLDSTTKQGLWSYLSGSDDDGGSRWDNFMVYG